MVNRLHRVDERTFKGEILGKAHKKPPSSQFG